MFAIVFGSVKLFIMAYMEFEVFVHFVIVLISNFGRISANEFTVMKGRRQSTVMNDKKTNLYFFSKAQSLFRNEMK